MPRARVICSASGRPAAGCAHRRAGNDDEEHGGGRSSSIKMPLARSLAGLRSRGGGPWAGARRRTSTSSASGHCQTEPGPGSWSLSDRQPVLLSRVLGLLPRPYWEPPSLSPKEQLFPPPGIRITFPWEGNPLLEPATTPLILGCIYFVHTPHPHTTST
jgi:hypothetical protein